MQEGRILDPKALQSRFVEKYGEVPTSYEEFALTPEQVARQEALQSLYKQSGYQPV